MAPRVSDKRLSEWVAEIDEATKLAEAPARDGAVDVVNELEPSQVRELAIRYLTDLVTDRRRAATRAVERSVERAQLMTELVRGGTPMKRLPRRGSVKYEEWVQHTEEGRSYEAGQRKAEAAAEAIRERHTRQMVRMLDDFIAEQRVEWTAELLDSVIAMPDGSVVLWGDATLAQHQERRDMFLRNALANTEGAARHEQAIRELTEAGAPNLRELVTVRG